MIAGKTAASWSRYFPLTPALDWITCPWLQGLLVSSGFCGEESEGLLAWPGHGSLVAAFRSRDVWRKPIQTSGRTSSALGSTCNRCKR